MRLLLDTHIFLWFATGNSRLRQIHRLAIENPANQVFLSVVSVWEATVKYERGKLALPSAAPAFLTRRRRELQIGSLLFPEKCISHLPKLPRLHNDPFDRMLICQAKAFGLRLVTEDSLILQYDLPTL